MIFLGGDQLMRRIMLCMGWCLGFVLTSPFATSGTPGTSDATATEFECVIEPHQRVKLASPVVGVIARLDVDRGDIVRRGQIVGKLEDGVEAATLALAQARATNEYVAKSQEARLQLFRSKHKRMNELYSKAVSSQASLEEADAAAKVAEQQLKEAELNREIAYLEIRRAEEVLKQRTLRSPIDGVVVERLLVPGEYQNEQNPILTLAQIDPLHVEVFMPTSYYGQIHTGSKAEVRPEQPVGGIYTAVVTVVDRVLDAASGTFGVRLVLPNPDLLLPAGIPCKVLFESSSAAAAPVESAQRSEVTAPQQETPAPPPVAEERHIAKQPGEVMAAQPETPAPPPVAEERHIQTQRSQVSAPQQETPAPPPVAQERNIAKQRREVMAPQPETPPPVAEGRRVAKPAVEAQPRAAAPKKAAPGDRVAKQRPTNEALNAVRRFQTGSPRSFPRAQ